MGTSVSVPQKSVVMVSAGSAAVGLGPQNQLLMPTITKSVCGSEHIASGFLVMPPLRVAKPHVHKKNELIIFFLEGFGVALIGPDYKPYYHGPGDFLYVPEGVIHFGVNLSAKHRATAVEVRTDPNFNDDVEIITGMETEAARVAADYQRRFAAGTLDVPESWKTIGVPGPYYHAF